MHETKGVRLVNKVIPSVSLKREGVPKSSPQQKQVTTPIQKRTDSTAEAPGDPFNTMCSIQDGAAVPKYRWQHQDDPFDKQWSKNPPVDSGVSEHWQSGAARDHPPSTPAAVAVMAASESESEPGGLRKEKQAVATGGTHMQLSKEFQRFQQYPNTAAASGDSAVPEDCDRQGPAQASSSVATTIQNDPPAAGEVASSSQSEPVEAPQESPMPGATRGAAASPTLAEAIAASSEGLMAGLQQWAGRFTNSANPQ